MKRLLLHQVDNNWEGAVTQLDNMSGLWYSKGSNILWTIVQGNKLYVFEDFLSGQTQGTTAAEINANPENEFKQVKVSWTHRMRTTPVSISFLHRGQSAELPSPITTMLQSKPILLPEPLSALLSPAFCLRPSTPSRYV
jgi:hypothetical protein